MAFSYSDNFGFVSLQEKKLIVGLSISSAGISIFLGDEVFFTPKINKIM